jgi:hypothetical protein
MISLKTVKVDSVAETRPVEVFDLASSEAAGGPGRLMVTRGAGRAVREALVEILDGMPKEGVLFVDTRGVELMDYSFADEAFGVLVSRVAGSEYGEKRVVLVEEDRDLLENVEASLRQRGLAMLRVEDVADGKASVVGEIPDHLVETLRAIEEAGSVTNSELAKRLGVNNTACNNRTTRLAGLGLIHRRRLSAAPGGRQFVCERVA